MYKRILIAIVIVAVAVLIALVIRKQPTIPISEKDLSAIPEEQRDYFKTMVAAIRSGGPPKDGIPAVDKPKYESASSANEWLQPNDVVFGLLNDGKPFAYPQRIVVWHEIVNETVNGIPSSITYCPLTGTVIGFKNPAPDSSNPTLGVSGKLVNSNLIMYDRASDSYWPQILGKAVMGTETGNSLEEFPIVWTTWAKWKKKYPDTRVLTKNTGFFRDYGLGGDPYGSYLDETGYYFKGGSIFPPINEDDRLGPKDVVVGLRDIDRNAVAILKDTLRKKKKMDVALGDRTVTVTYDPELDFYAAADKETGETVNAFDSMWFPWFSYYPDTELIQ